MRPFWPGRESGLRAGDLEIPDRECPCLVFLGPGGFEMAPLVNPVVDLKKHPEKV